MNKQIFLIPVWMLFLTLGLMAKDGWNQFNGGPSRQARVEHSVRPPYATRWIWMGEDHILRNKGEGEGEIWKDDLTSEEGKVLDMPDRVNFSFAESMQPIVTDGRVFVANSQNAVIALSLEDGSTLWQSPMEGGSLRAGCVAGNAVVFASIFGEVKAIDMESGKKVWSYDCGRAATAAPLYFDKKIFVPDHGGILHALDPKDGKTLWTRSFDAPLVGGMCGLGDSVYFGAEDMNTYRISARDGKTLASRKLRGQSFRMTWPVALGKHVVFTVVPLPFVGSEFVNDPILAGTPDKKIGYQPKLKQGYKDRFEEEQAVRNWIKNGGGEMEGSYWEIHFVLNAKDLSKDNILATGTTNGCGSPALPPAIGPKGLPVLWWATAFGITLKDCGFGTNFTVDLAAFDPDTCLRQPLTEKAIWGQTTETDNLYAMSFAGDTLFLSQGFRGKSVLELDRHQAHGLSAHYRHRDGGSWQRVLNYAQGNRDLNMRKWPDTIKTVPELPSNGTGCGPVSVAIAEEKILFVESFAVTCMRGVVK